MNGGGAMSDAYEYSAFGDAWATWDRELDTEARERELRLDGDQAEIEAAMGVSR